MLTQDEADFLMRMPKKLVGVGTLFLPAPGNKQTWKAKSIGGREEFLIDYYQGRIRLSRVTMQERHGAAEILLRLDMDGRPHRNPDGTVVPPPHFHVYREGYGDRWAYPVPKEIDVSSGDPAQILANFLRYCGVNPVPPIQGGMVP